jgi:integrase
MATIRKRGNLQWEARVRRKGHPVTCKTFETKVDAEAWARQIESEIDRGVFVSRAEAESTTLNEAIDRYIAEYIPRLAQVYKETTRAKALQYRAIASRIMATIRSKDIADLIREREAEGVSGNTIRLDLALLSRLFNVAHADWGMESLVNPVERATKPKIAKGRERRLEDSEEEKLLGAATPLFRPVICFAIETAMRREEMATLDWDRVDLKKRSVFLAETKNGEARSVPLSPAALALLAAQPKPHEGPVFGMSASAMTQAMEAARRKAGLENLRLHDLRHEATSRLFEQTDLDVMEIKTITGHKSLQMLARYSHLRTHRLADRLAGMKRGK